MTTVLERDPGTRAKRGRTRRARRRTLIVLLLLAVGATAGLGAQRLISSGDEETSDAIGTPIDGRQVTTLLVTTLADDASQQADGLTLFGIDPDGTEPVIMFIPVDTLAEVPGGGSMEIGKAMTFGRLSLVELAVENLLGLQIDRTLGIDDLSIATMINDLGGIQVDVREELYEPDDQGRLQLVFPQGPQEMDGVAAVTYLTYRGVGSTDLERFPRAQKIWQGVFAHGAGAMGTAVTGLGDAVAGLDGAAGLAEILEAFARAEDRTFEVMPPEPVGSGGDEEVYQVDVDALAAVIDRAFAGSRPPAGPGRGARVELRNGNGVPEVGERVAALLIPDGMRIVLSGNARSFDFPTTRVVVYGDDDQAIALGRRIVELLGVGEVEIGTRGQTVADVTVVVGRDFIERQE